MPITQKGRREFLSDVKKKNICETAISMFRCKGYEHTTIADISKATNTSVGSIYHFFGSKEGILTTAIKEPGAYVIVKNASWEDKLNDPRGTVGELMHRYADFFDMFGPDLVKHMGSAMLSVYNDNTGRFIDTASTESLCSFIQACQERGTLNKKRPADEYTQILLTTMQSTLLLWTRFEFNIHEKMDYYLDIVFTEMSVS